MSREHRVTDRLLLDRVVTADRAAFVDVETALRRRADPPRDPPDPATWSGYLTEFVAVWDRGDLGYWTVRHDGDVIGFGGVKAKRWRGTDCWNLYYRLHPRWWGRGFATEMGREAVAVATDVSPGRPVLVETGPTNVSAIAVAERVGLRRRPDLDDDGWAVLLLER